MRILFTAIDKEAEAAAKEESFAAVFSVPMEEEMQNNTQIDTIIFDIGRVLAGYGWDSLLKTVTTDPQVFHTLERAVFMNPAWVEHDKGLLDEEAEIQDFIAAAPEYEREIRKVYENLGECVWKLDYAAPWVQELKEKGYRVYALSNWPKHVYELREDKLDFLELMDGYILSYR